MSINTMWTKTEQKNSAHPEKDVTPLASAPLGTDKSAGSKTSDDSTALPKAPGTEPAKA